MELSGQLHDPAALLPDKEPPVSTRQEAGWAPEPVWTQWRREKFPAPAGNGSPSSSSGRDAKLAINIHVVPRLRLREPTPPLHQYVFIAWWLVKHRDDLTFTFVSLDGI
jgi:hypothetical protein